jgi:MFS superfamily sulfate permease-like transporter
MTDSAIPALSPSPSTAPLAPWRRDAGAGFLVFLIALPLCLGVSVASGFPPMAGILTAIVGGLLVSRINGSHLTVTGPAAGLIVVILNAVDSLGEGDALAGYRYTLAAIVVSGVLQILLGRFRAGRFAALFPVSVVHGMLAAIGIMIIAKQIPVMAGLHPEGSGMLAGIARLPGQLAFFVPQAMAIALVGLAILIGWPRLETGWLRRIPAPIVVVASGMLLAWLFDLAHLAPKEGFRFPEQLGYASDFRVSIPDSLAASLQFPDFSKVLSLVFWQNVLAIALVGSLETLLVAAAVDKLDPERRMSDLNKDLQAIGIGNTVAGMIGGLPMIAEIVRSSAGIAAGARSGWTNFFHGALLLMFVAAVPGLIGAIPLASLAALLVYTGFRLCSPAAFAKTMDVGREQLALFVITIVGSLATNLLAGVAVGIAAKLALHAGRGVPLNQLLKLSYRVEKQDHRCVVKVQGSALFSNLLSLKSELAGFADGKTVVFDLTDTYLIDHTVMDFIDRYRDDYIERGGRCEIHGLDDHEAYAEHPLAARRNEGAA